MHQPRKNSTKNSYTVVFNLGVDPSTGKRKQQWLSVKGSKKDAEKRLAELISQIDTGSFVKPGKTTLAEFLERWLKEYATPNLAPRTAEDCQHVIRRHLVPALGSLPLIQLRPEHIQRYYADKLIGGRCDAKGSLSPTTVRHHHMVLHDALESAVKWGLLSRNPADAVSPPRRQRTEMHTLDEDGIHSVLEAAKSTEYYHLFYLALFTGMRRSELLALRWSDVDPIMCQLSVSRTLHYLRDGTFTFRQPKTVKGRRTVALSPSAVQALRQHREKEEALSTALGRTLAEDSLVFSRTDGKPLLPNTVTHAWIKLVRRIGLDGVRLHDARHTHASLMLKQGVHPKIVQERLGHASIQITLDTYSHVAPGLQQAAAAGFDNLVCPKLQEERLKASVS